MDTGHPDQRIREPKKADASVKFERFNRKRHAALTSLDLMKYHTGLTWFGAKTEPSEVIRKGSGYLIVANDDEAAAVLNRLDFNAMGYAERVNRPGFSYEKFYRHFDAERSRYRSHVSDQSSAPAGSNDNKDRSLAGKVA